MPLVFRTTDLTKWGAGTPGPLTKAQVDLNFWQLLERLVEVESNPLQPNQIDFIQVDDNQMTIYMTDYTSFGPFTLPQAAFNFTGDFQADHDYKRYDFLTARDGFYMVLHDFTSGPTFVFGADIEGPWYQLIMPFPKVFDIGFSSPGTPGRGIAVDEYEAQAMWTYRAGHQFYLPADLTGTVGGLFIETTDALEFPIMNGLDEIGTINIEAGGSEATFTLAANAQFEINDTLRILRMQSLDLTAKDLSVTFIAVLGTP